MAKRKNVIAPEARAMDLVAQKKDENISAVTQIFSRLGILGTEYDSLFFIQTAKYLMDLHENTGIAFGAVILSIKEHEPHGNFLNALKQIGIQPRKAQFYMNYAKRYSKYENFSHLSNSKLDLFEAFSDEELKKLNTGEDVNGLTLDAIDELPASQVRKRLREAEKKLAAQKERHKKELEDKLDEIKDLTMRVSNTEPPTKEQIALAALQNFSASYTLTLSGINGGMRKAYSIVREAEKTPGVNVQQLNEWLSLFNEEMRIFDEVKQGWLDEVDNVTPIEVGKIREA
jgi:hypothetical protein